MNAYSKYVPNVFLAKCTEKHVKGEIITIENCENALTVVSFLQQAGHNAGLVMDKILIYSTYFGWQGVDQMAEYIKVSGKGAIGAVLKDLNNCIDYHEGYRQGFKPVTMGLSIKQI